MYPIFAEFADGENRWQVCLADCPDYFGVEALSELLYTEHSRDLDHTDILIVRPRVDQSGLSADHTSDGIQPLRKRAPRASLHVLYSQEFEHVLTDNVNGFVESLLPSSEKRLTFLRWLQEKELATYVDHSSALFRANPNFVYRAPSERFVNMFLRVGNVQRNRQVLDAFFFWMLPYLKHRNAILVETWSISSIALNAGRFLERYWRSIGPEQESPVASPNLRECRVDMLSSYADRHVASMPDTIHALRRLSENGKRDVLVVLSAICTGSSFERLRAAIADPQFREDEFGFLALYKLSQTIDLPYLCDLSEGNVFSTITREDVGGRTVIEVDRSAYFPLHIEESPQSIKPSDTSATKEFFTRYRNSAVVSIHRSAVDLSRQEQRHHGIYIDVTKMLEIETFRERLSSAVSEIPKNPDIVIVPPHEAGGKLAEAVVARLLDHYGVAPPSLLHADLSSRGGEVPEVVKNSTPEHLLLIVDDVSITGQRLSRYQQNLRELGYLGQIVYLVGVARPASSETWRRRKINLEYRSGHKTKHKLLGVEYVILPDWDSSQCPWCAEVEGLARLLKSGGLAETVASHVKSRISTLNRARLNDGLIKNAFWQSASNEGLHLTIGSIFLGLEKNELASEADVIGSVAAALQQMRTARPEAQRLAAAYPHVSVLDHEQYLGHTFNDDILRFAILRCARRDELERWKFEFEEERKNRITEFLRSEDTADVFKLELAIARLAGKIPPPDLVNTDWAELSGWPTELWARLVAI